MPLSKAEESALKTAAQAEAALSAQVAAGRDAAVADWLNAETSPAFWVWRRELTRDMIYDALDWTEVAALTDAQRMMLLLLLQGASLDPTRPNVRAAFIALFGSGTNTRAALIAASRRVATNAERAVATGTGSQAAPATIPDAVKITPEVAGKILRG